MRTAPATAILSALLAIGLSRQTVASLTVTGSVRPNFPVPIVQPPTAPPTAPIGNELLKIRLEVPHDSTLLCLGTFSDIFSSPPKCGQPLGDPVGPGGRAGPQAIFLVNTTQLVGNYLYVWSYPNTPATSFSLTIE
jgi:hypothetical protein